MTTTTSKRRYTYTRFLLSLSLFTSVSMLSNMYVCMYVGGRTCNELMHRSQSVIFHTDYVYHTYVPTYLPSVPAPLLLPTPIYI